jgi:hypothetical protein
MDSHDVRDPDGVIDEVARAMTSTELTRDLRPAVASRIVSPPSWAFGWRAGVAAVVVAAVVLRPSPEPQRPQTTVADTGGARAATPPPSVPDAADPRMFAEGQAGAIGRVSIPVARQTVVEASASATVVEIAPLAFVPLEADSLEPVEQVEIAPIDVEPVRLSQLELVE